MTRLGVFAAFNRIQRGEKIPAPQGVRVSLASPAGGSPAARRIIVGAIRRSLTLRARRSAGFDGGR